MTTATNHPTPELLSESALAEIEARIAKLPEGPWFAAFDPAKECGPHRDSGLALVDTGRESDWPIARLCEWHAARFIAASITDIPALCATVRALREKHTRLAEASDEWASLLDRIRLWSKCADGYPLDEHINNITTQNTALRDQLAQADETNRLAGLQIVGLEFRLAQVEKERARNLCGDVTHCDTCADAKDFRP